MDEQQTAVQVPGPSAAGQALNISIQPRDSWGNLITDANSLDLNGSIILGPNQIEYGLSSFRQASFSSLSLFSDEFP